MGIVLLAIAGAGVMYYMAGQEDGPTITIHSPDEIRRPLDAAGGIGRVADRAGRGHHQIEMEQNGKAVALANMKIETPGPGRCMPAARSQARAS